MAATHGVNAVARALRLNYDDLKERAESAGSCRREVPARRGQSNEHSPCSFVEVKASPLLPPAGCTIEMEDEQGRRLTLRLSSAVAVDLASLAQALWSRPS